MTDRPGIHAVHVAAFGRPGVSVVAEAGLVDALRADGDAVPALSLVAEADGTVVGHVVCSRAHIDSRPALGLGPLGVLPEHQGRGVGSALMHGVLAAADALDEPAVVLLGDAGYYRRFGFEPARPLGVVPVHPEWVPHFQVRRLHTWTAALRGTFHYAPAFGRL
ncbi:GNAT family N-acetyltransferase [Nocardioides donggukensis]|uniref:GNAT family N-acetyltransferase n=1 Tax=Nocardioides donggukensis TaxID=2774019 RepID=UPI00191EECAB|nr:N-acetyltransferase [Nocardioides donggukensis]